MLTVRTKIIEERLYTDQPNWMPIDPTAVDQSILDSYELTGCELYLLCGVSTVGKNTLLTAAQAENTSLSLIPRATTRPPRSGEKDGVDYFFSFKNVLVWSEFGGHYYAITEQVIQRLAEVRTGIMIQGLLYGFVLKQLLEPRGVTVHLVYVLPDVLTSGYKAWLDIIQKRLLQLYPERAQFRIESIKRELRFVAKHLTTLKKKGVQFIENIPTKNGISPQTIRALRTIMNTQ